MGYLKEQVSYIRGMADGLSLDPSTKEGKVLIAMLSFLGDMADSVESNETSVDELTESIEEIKDDMENLESQVYGEDLDFSPWSEDEEKEAGPDFVEMVCPNCSDTIFFDADMINSGEPLVCPSCDKPMKRLSGE